MWKLIEDVRSLDVGEQHVRIVRLLDGSGYLWTNDDYGGWSGCWSGRYGGTPFLTADEAERNARSYPWDMDADDTGAMTHDYGCCDYELETGCTVRYADE